MSGSPPKPTDYRLERTDASHPAYRRLVEGLDADLAVTDGEEHAFYDQFNGSEDIHHVVLLRWGGDHVACGAFKYFGEGTVEIKRMYTAPAARGKKLARAVLQELERWAAELGYRRMILETGSRQLAAIRLYEAYGFERLAENYGPYRGVANSICMEKAVRGKASIVV